MFHCCIIVFHANDVRFLPRFSVFLCANLRHDGSHKDFPSICTQIGVNKAPVATEHCKERAKKGKRHEIRSSLFASITANTVSFCLDSSLLCYRRESLIDRRLFKFPSEATLEAVLIRCRWLPLILNFVSKTE